MAKLSIVIVNWNTEGEIQDCLNSIKKYSPNSDTYVVDNASSDKSVEVIKSKFPWVKLTVNKTNLGFAKANSQILRKIKSGYVLILNPDTRLQKNSLEPLISYLESNENVGAVGPLLLNPDGSVQYLGMYRKSPSLIQALFFYTDLYRLSIKSKLLTRLFWESDINGKKVQSVDQIPGACLMSSTEVLKKVNFFDDDFPFWFEDVDLCFKLRKKGYKLFCVPESKIIHKVGSATDKWQDRAKKEARFFKSMFLFFDKNKPGIESGLIRFIIVVSQIFMLVSRSLMQIFKPNRKRLSFIKLKIGILWNLSREQELPRL